MAAASPAHHAFGNFWEIEPAVPLSAAIAQIEYARRPIPRNHPAVGAAVGAEHTFALRQSEPVAQRDRFVSPPRKAAIWEQHQTPSENSTAISIGILVPTAIDVISKSTGLVVFGII